MDKEPRRFYCGRFDRWQSEEDEPLPCQMKGFEEREELKEERDGARS